MTTGESPHTQPAMPDNTSSAGNAATDTGRQPGDFNLDFLACASLTYEDPALLRYAKRNGWAAENDIHDYGQARFSNAYPTSSLVEIIAQEKKPGRPNVGMDILGGKRGLALCDLLTRNVLDAAVIVDLAAQPDEAPEHPGLRHVAGDIMRRETWLDMRKAQQELAPEGLALIMHRPLGALQQQLPAFYEGAAHALLDMLRPGGILFAQQPDRLFFGREHIGSLRRSLNARGDVGRITLSDPSLYKFRDERAVLIFKK